MNVHISPWIVIPACGLFWFAVQLGFSALALYIGPSQLEPGRPMFRERQFERGGKLYEQVFFIRRWKERLPDGAAFWGKGFRKKRLESLDSDYYQTFVRETCRAELTHWMQIPPALLFLFTGNWPLTAAMLVYAVLVNLPCILAQRYNRIRFLRVLHRRQRSVLSEGHGV
jgi:glycosyl-4,4'-diaponeurosporenoate acyltransferase